MKSYKVKDQISFSEVLMRGSKFIVSLKWIEYGVYGDLSIIYQKPYSIYLRGAIGLGKQRRLSKAKSRTRPSSCCNVPRWTWVISQRHC